MFAPGAFTAHRYSAREENELGLTEHRKMYMYLFSEGRLFERESSGLLADSNESNFNNCLFWQSLPLIASNFHKLGLFWQGLPLITTNFDKL